MGEETHGSGRMSETQQWVSLPANGPIVSTSSTSFLETSNPLRAWDNEIFSSHMSDGIVEAATVQPIKEEDHRQDLVQPLEHFSSNIPSSLLNNTEGETCPPFSMLNHSGHIYRIKKPSPDSCSFSSQQKHLEKPITSRITPFKVRKEKLGDRFAALQQLVSPFGKTDTASVLLDAIEYIKCLHEQLTVLCSPYVKMVCIFSILEIKF
uniref:Transcription factor bHLH112-like isoform X1 n=1 Tax=Elaeis guineensis var. tenera TaxID=51953 RepID=A0A6J0PPV9_ELAGV|nr:transcription factor bHLH112-like isoform X1 [Elaeis guineensis]